MRFHPWRRWISLSCAPYHVGVLLPIPCGHADNSLFLAHNCTVGNAFFTFLQRRFDQSCSPCVGRIPSTFANKWECFCFNRAFHTKTPNPRTFMQFSSVRALHDGAILFPSFRFIPPSLSLVPVAKHGHVHRLWEGGEVLRSRGKFVCCSGRGSAFEVLCLCAPRCGLWNALVLFSWYTPLLS